MAAAIGGGLSPRIFSPPVPATRPAVISSESPGRKKPTRSPVSVNTMATRTAYPPQRIRSSSAYRPLATSRRNSTGRLLPAHRGAHPPAHPRRGRRGSPATDAHGIERPPDEDDRDAEEPRGQKAGQRRAALGRERDGELHRQQAEERGEFDDRIHGDRGRVLEGVPDRVSHDGGGVEGRPLLLQLHLDDP